MKSASNDGKDCWLTRVSQIKAGFGIVLSNKLSSDLIGQMCKSKLQSKFEKSCLESMNEIKCKDDRDSNKF